MWAQERDRKILEPSLPAGNNTVERIYDIERARVDHQTMHISDSNESTSQSLRAVDILVKLAHDFGRGAMEDVIKRELATRSRTDNDGEKPASLNGAWAMGASLRRETETETVFITDNA